MPKKSIPIRQPWLPPQPFRYSTPETRAVWLASGPDRQRLLGQVELALPARGARPRFLNEIVAALLVLADEDGVVEDARRQLADVVDGAERCTLRHERRLLHIEHERKRIDAILDEIYSDFDEAERAGDKVGMAAARLAARPHEERLRLLERSPVYANISRALTWLEAEGFIGRWYRRDDGETSDEPRKGYRVTVGLSDDLLDLRGMPSPGSAKTP